MLTMAGPRFLTGTAARSGAKLHRLVCCAVGARPHVAPIHEVDATATAGLLQRSLHKDCVISGQVTQGQDVAEMIASVQVGPGNQGELSRPVQDVLLKKVTIAETDP